MAEGIRIGLGQVELRMGDKDANCSALLNAIEGCAKRHCDLVVLPECGLAGWLSAAAGSVAEQLDGSFCNRLQSAAKQHGIAIVAGFEERNGDRVYNSAIFVDEHGAIRTRHRKINELTIATALYHTGKTLEVIEWRGHTTALLICADCWRPEFVDAVRAMGANLILSPCAWAVAPGGEETNLAWITETYRQRIESSDLTIVSANGVGRITEGPWRGRVLQGNSLAIGRHILAKGLTNEPQLVVFDYVPHTELAR